MFRKPFLPRYKFILEMLEILISYIYLRFQELVTQEITVEFPEPFAKPDPKEETAVCPLCKKG